MLIMSVLREDLIGVTMFPAALNMRSDGLLVAVASTVAKSAYYMRFWVSFFVKLREKNPWFRFFGLT